MAKALSLFTIFAGLWRRRLLVAALVLIAVSAAFIMLSLTPPRYSASAVIAVPQDRSATAVTTMGSRRFAGRIIEQLSLMDDPAFNPRFAGNKTSDKFKSLSLYQGELDRLSLYALRKDKAVVMDRFLDGLLVEGDENGAVSVRYRALSGEQAAFIANNIADKYVADQVDEEAEARGARHEQQRRDQGAKLRAALQAAEMNVVKFREREESAPATSTAVEDQTLAKLRDELKAAKAHYNDIVNKPQKNTVPAKNLALINSLKQQEKKARASIAELSKRYGEKHPKMISQRRALRKIRSRLYTARGIVAVEVEHEADIAQARVNNMERIVNSMAAQVPSAPVPKVEPINLDELAALEDLVAQAREALDVFEAEVAPEEAAAQIDTDAAVRVLSYAEAPRAPYWPNKPLILSLVAAGALVFGALLGGLLSAFDKTCRTEKQIEAWFDFPCLGAVPSVKGVKEAVRDAALKRLYVSLILRQKQTGRVPTQAPQEGEGAQGTGLQAARRSSVFAVMDADQQSAQFALDLARVAARDGARVMVIDADFYAPRLHDLCAQSNAVSVVDYLAGETALDKIIQTGDVSGAHMMYGRRVPHSALNLVKSSKLTTLIAAFRQAYDLVILHAPPREDAAVIAHLSDQMLHVITADKTQRGDIARGLKYMRDAGYQKVGLVLMDVKEVQDA